MIPQQHRFFSLDAFKAYILEQSALNRTEPSNRELTELFSKSATVYAAAMLWADNISLLRFDLVDENDQIVEEDSLAANAIRNAIERNITYVLGRSEVTWRMWGSNLLQKRISFGGELTLRWLNPNLWQIDQRADGLYGFYVIRGPEIPDLSYLPINQAIYHTGVDFSSDFEGVAPAEVAFLQGAVEVEMAQTVLALFRNMAVPSAFVQPAAEGAIRPTKNDRDMLAGYIRTMIKGSGNFGKTIVTPSRWEIIRLSQPLNELELHDIDHNIVVKICGAMHTPPELVVPGYITGKSGGSNPTQLYDINRNWLLTRFKPHSWHIAEAWTEQMVRPANPKWKLRPNFRLIEGLKQDIDSRTSTVKAWQESTLVTVGYAQKELGLPILKELEDMVVIQGVPIPLDQVREFWRFQPGMPGQVPKTELGDGGENLPKPKQLPAPATPVAPKAAAGKSEDVIEGEAVDVVPLPRLSDEVYTEFKNWQILVARKGAAYDFKAQHLSVDVVSLGKLMLATSPDPLAVFPLLRQEAVKDYPGTERNYRSTLYDLLTSAFGGRLDRKQFGELGRTEIEAAFKQAFLDGLRASGVNADQPEEEEQAYLNSEIKAERGYWTNFANDIYRNMLPLLQQAQEKQDFNAWEQFLAKRQESLKRIDAWVNKGLRRISETGRYFGKMNEMQEWVLGATEKHCRTCKSAEGQVHRAKTWLASGIIPQSSALECHGDHCDCRLEPSAKKSTGRISTIYLAAKSDEEQEEAELASISAD